MTPESRKSIAVLQSFYLPWSGAFNQAASADVFVVGDDFQYSKNSWINRNRIKTPSGDWQWLTVPIKAKDAMAKKISEIEINYHDDWVKKHLTAISCTYKRSPFFDDLFPLIEDALQKRPKMLFDLNYDLFMKILGMLHIETKITLRSSYQPLNPEKSHSLIDIIKAENATHYLTGPSAKDYLNEGLFRENGITFEYQSYPVPEYPQLWGNFVPGMSMIDTIFSVGAQDARRIVDKSYTCQKVIGS